MKTLISRQTLTALAMVVLSSTLVVAADIDFGNGTWTHPNGTSTDGWDSSQTTGTTTLPDGSTVSVTITMNGTASASPQHLTYQSNSYIEGFAFGQIAGNATNSGAIANYMRIDFVFSQTTILDNFVVGDVDGDEVIQVEGWESDTPGGPGSGTAANYTMGGNLQAHTQGGIPGVTRTPDSDFYTVMSADNNVGFAFDEGIKSLSIYYSTKPGAGMNATVINIEGDINISAADPRLYFTYDMTNNDPVERLVDFHNTLPEGLTFDTEFMELVGTLSGNPITFSNNNRTASANDLVLHPGTNSLKLRTLETSLTGLIENVATMDPKHPSLETIVQTTSITLP